MFRCRDLFNLYALKDVRLLCGKNGLDNIIRWPYKTETLDFKKWTKGHELLIISRAIIQNPDFILSRIISQAIDLNLSGALILTGKDYISSIPKSLIKKCDEKSFPLFLISASVPMINIFEEMGYAIVLSNEANTYKDSFLGSLIFGNTDVEFLKINAEKLSYPANGMHVIFYINVFISETSKNSFILDEFMFSKIKEDINTETEKNNLKILLSNFGSTFIGICFIENKATEQLLKNSLENFIQKYNSLYKNMFFAAGIGTPKIFNNIRESFSEAKSVCEIACKMEQTNQVLFYKYLGILKVFDQIPNKNVLKNFKNELLSNLIAYEKTHNIKLMHTLFVYLENNCLISDTASKLNLHRNTVIYRIKKSENLLNHSLDDSFFKLNLYNALLIHFYIS